MKSLVLLALFALLFLAGCGLTIPGNPAMTGLLGLGGLGGLGGLLAPAAPSAPAPPPVKGCFLVGEGVQGTCTVTSPAKGSP